MEWKSYEMNLKDLLYTVNRRLSDLERFNNLPRIRKESVSEHCFYVAFYVMMLSRFIPGINVEKALKMALIHDLEESISGDVPHTLKLQYPILNEHLEETNKKIINDMFSGFDNPDEYIALWQETRGIETEEARLVKVADYLSVLFYSNDEGQLGNTFMEKVYERQRLALLEFIDLCPQYEFVRDVIQ
jgi:putative hydrolase of HD superfamily